MPFGYSAGARNIFNQLKSKGWSFTSESGKQPKPGDIVSWWRTSLASGNGHIGIVHHCNDGFLYTIEGNTAANVAGFYSVKARLDKDRRSVVEGKRVRDRLERGGRSNM